MSAALLGDRPAALVALVVLLGLLVLFGSLFAVIRWRRRDYSVVPVGTPRVPHVLILSPTPSRGPDEVKELIGRIWPGGLGHGARITTYVAPPVPALAEALVMKEEAEGRLPPGSHTRMSVVLVDPEHLVMAVHARAPDPSRLPAEREQIARHLAVLLLASMRQWDELNAAQRDTVIDMAHLDALVASGEDVEGWLQGAVELRAVGHRLDQEGGMRLMVSVAHRAAALTEEPGALRWLEMRWDGIGAWMG